MSLCVATIECDVTTVEVGHHLGVAHFATHARQSDGGFLLYVFACRQFSISSDIWWAYVEEGDEKLDTMILLDVGCACVGRRHVREDSDHLILGEERRSFLGVTGFDEDTSGVILQEVVARHAVGEGHVCEGCARQKKHFVRGCTLT